MAAPRRFSSSVVVDAPVDTVWELLSDTRRYAEYVEATLAVTRSDGMAHVGATYDERNKFLGPVRVSSRWRVTEYDAPRSQVHVCDRWPLVDGLRIGFECEPVDGGTRVSQWLEFTPKVPFLVRAFAGQVQRDLDRTTANLKALAEREAPAPAPA